MDKIVFIPAAPKQQNKNSTVSKAATAALTAGGIAGSMALANKLESNFTKIGYKYIPGGHLMGMKPGEGLYTTVMEKTKIGKFFERLGRLFERGVFQKIAPYVKKILPKNVACALSRSKYLGYARLALTATTALSIIGILTAGISHLRKDK